MTANKGAGWTVARSGTGHYVVTLDDAYPGLLSASSLQHNAAADKKVHLGAIDVASAKTIVILMY
jgi:hypothetical protein